MAMQRLQTTGEIAVNTFKQYLTACVLLSLTLSTLLCFPHDIQAQKESTVFSTGGIQNTNCKLLTSALDLPRSGGTDHKAFSRCFWWTGKSQLRSPSREKETL